MRITLTNAARWIAFNDEPTISDPRDIETLATVQLIADISGKLPLEVAVMVSKMRRHPSFKDSRFVVRQ